MAKACFISDLHLFANRSQASRHLGAIRSAAADSDRCILGGDIFDFKWSTLPNAKSTVQAAVDWLRDLSTGAPGCQIHFVLGNHDFHPELIDLLPELAADQPNFSWEHFYLRIGDAMFLHGDVADRGMTAQQLEVRRRQFRHDPRSRHHHRAYDLLVKSHLHAVVPHAVYPHRVVARRIVRYLREIGHGPESGVRQVYFGHTHRPVHRYLHEGIHFHNGGAPIGRSKFRLLHVDLPE